tara:strand:+ start:2952 stop:3203 length:252 start_codon:yes stop_codon:yes gene_type:complete
MTANFVEFTKVFLIVFTFSGGILALRKFMLSFDQEEEQPSKDLEENIVHFPKREVAKDIVIEPDFIDYDGMGNQGRFPRSNRK